MVLGRLPLVDLIRPLLRGKRCVNGGHLRLKDVVQLIEESVSVNAGALHCSLPLPPDGEEEEEEIVEYILYCARLAIYSLRRVHNMRPGKPENVLAFSVLSWEFSGVAPVISSHCSGLAFFNSRLYCLLAIRFALRVRNCTDVLVLSNDVPQFQNSGLLCFEKR